MVQWPLPQTRQARGQLLAHKMFHRIEPLLGIPIEDAPNDQLDLMQGRLWMFLEWRALAVALSTPPGSTQESAVADALLFRQHRQSLFAGAFSRERALGTQRGACRIYGHHCQ